MTARLRRLVRRAPSERRALAHAVLLHAVVAALCRVVSYGRVTRWLDRAYPEQRDAIAFDPANPKDARAAWAASTAASLWPSDTTCLSAALTVRCVLRRAGRTADVRFGVPADPASSRGFAHAWVESRGLPVTGYRPGQFLVLGNGR